MACIYQTPALFFDFQTFYTKIEMKKVCIQQNDPECGVHVKCGSKKQWRKSIERGIDIKRAVKVIKIK